MESSLDSRWIANNNRNLSEGYQERPIPLPHEDFEPYFSQYAEYDSVLGESLSTVHELSIPSGGSSIYSMDSFGGATYSAPPSSPPMHPSDLQSARLRNQATVKPSSLARYSKMMNYNNVAITPAALSNENAVALQAYADQLNPQLISPMKNIGASSDIYLQDAAQNISSPSLSSPGPGPMVYTSSSSISTSSLASSYYQKGNSNNNIDNNINNNFTVSSSYLDPNGLHSSPMKRGQSALGESDSDAYISSSEHSQSPNVDTSPDINSGDQFYTGVTPGLASMNIFSSIDMGAVDASSSIAWQPVITAPKNEVSQEIIKMQQSSGKQSNRKSCLPPGKVDSYMAGPNPEGLFECLFPNCGKLFRRRYNVRSHIQTHLCDRPYSCDSCGACFVRPHDLRRHEKCHQEDRPYKCPCGKGFTRHDALQRHRIRMICIGGIEIPGKPKKVPGKRGRPRKVRSMMQMRPINSSESDSEEQPGSPYSDHGLEYMDRGPSSVKDEVLWSR